MCIKLVRKLPKDRVTFAVVNQLIRSSASVGANIAEGYGRFGTKEYARFLQIALGSANETEYWLLLIKDSYPKFLRSIDQIIAKNQESIKMLTSSLKSLRAK